ncbi:MAG: hypothetical protein NZ872_06635 [Archaeoglobaceae archaeon]|nr:hypothetical protein [Archaeoglobaceae archaeon]MDW8128875.1 hypothetical protein [Archaeoglobaceae archaeon]
MEFKEGSLIQGPFWSEIVKIEKVEAIADSHGIEDNEQGQGS